ncbi:MAG: metal ABC transporter permease [Bacteroidales bacterium]
MTEILSLFQYQMFVNAVVAAILSGITCGIVGSYIVSKRIVFISGGITHASFGGIGLALFLGISPLLGGVFFAALAAIGVKLLSQKSSIREDSSIAIWWALGMSLGVIFTKLTNGYTPSIESFLFGSILGVTNSELLFMLILAIAIIAIFSILYRPILYSAFDESYAKVVGLPVNLINYSLSIVIAVTIVLNIRVAGVILIIALMTIPQAIAGLISKSLGQQMILSSIFGAAAAVLGLYISYFADIPSGPSIVLALIAVYLIVWGFTKFKKSKSCKQQRA